MNMVIFLIFLIAVACLIGYDRHKRLCVEISAKRKIEFYRQAKGLLESGSLNERQKDRVFKWADTIGKRKYAWQALMAIHFVCHEMRTGVMPRAEPEQTADFTSEMRRLFSYWLMAQIYSMPSMMLYAFSCLAYIETDHETERSAQIEVSREVFGREPMPIAA